VADPGFDLKGGLCQQGGGGVKIILACFGHISIKLVIILKLIASEVSEEQN